MDAVVVSECPTPNVFGGVTSSCKRRGCPVCGVRWAKRWETITSENLRAYGGPVALVSVTAPGADRLPWKCGRQHVHSGPRGCRVDSDIADFWSETAPARFSNLRDAARVATLRAVGVAPTLLERVWEPQKRGVPHVHLVLGMGSPAEVEAANRFAHELARLAPEYGFGHVDRGKPGPDGVRRLPTISAREAARYLSGYLLGRSRRKGTIRENIADPRMPRSLIWLTPALSSLSDSPRIAAMRERLGLERGTGVTMRRLRYAMWALAAARGVCSRLPVLRGQELVDVAQVCALLERARRDTGGDEPDPDEERRRWALLLMRMRQLELPLPARTLPLRVTPLPLSGDSALALSAGG